MNTPTNETEFLCAACGSEWTHVEHAVAAVRPAEDGVVTHVAISTRGDIKINDPKLQVEGTGRRDVFTLRVTCEQCPATSEVRYQQHKGQTFVSTKVLPTP